MNQFMLRFGVILGLALPASALACLQGAFDLPRVKPSLYREDVFRANGTSRSPGPPTFEAPKLDFTNGPRKPGESDEVTEDEARRVYRVIVQSHAADRVYRTRAEYEAEALRYSTSLIFLGRVAEAIPVLVELERKYPGGYATASNLGTAYELAGDVPNALTWIEEGIKRNPKSHGGSEWLHVAILRTKLKLREDSTWLASHSVLDADVGHPDPVTLQAIEYQLNERLRFVQPLDPVVCDLFYQAARRVTGETAPARREYLLNESLRFGALRANEIAKLRGA